MSVDTNDDLDRLEEKLRRRTNVIRNPLETNSVINIHRGDIPNTPLASATVAFLLGSVFSFGIYTFVADFFQSARWLTYQLGFFVAAWAFFHWAEFAVTAGWNFEKCSVDCMFPFKIILKRSDTEAAYLLENGVMYHAANGAALLEYLVSLYFFPSIKTWPYISQIGRVYYISSPELIANMRLGILMVIFGQTLRSMAMIHASTNFSHSVAFRKSSTHQLVTDGVYRFVYKPRSISLLFIQRSVYQLVSTSILRWILLLGIRYTIGPPKPLDICPIRHTVVAILLLSHSRCVCTSTKRVYHTDRS